MLVDSKLVSIYIYIWRLNIHGTHVTANNSTNNNVMFCFISDWKIVCYNNFDHNALDKREKNILHHKLFGDKINQNCLKIDATH